MLHLDAMERIVGRHDLGIKPMHRIPGARHAHHAQVGCPQAALDTHALLQSRNSGRSAAQPAPEPLVVSSFVIFLREMSCLIGRGAAGDG
jgi:hypothetical protein